MSKLIIMRHHESEWNKKGLWTGTRDAHLTEYGFQKSEEMGLLIRDIPIDYAFASMQVRTIETLSCVLNVNEQFHVPTQHSSALNERDYGDYTGKNKWDMQKLVGVEQWDKIRREWNCPVPHGESLKMVYERVVPFFREVMLPLIRAQKNVLVVSHGNALRALMKYIENVSDDGIADIEMPFGGVIIYELNDDGRMLTKEVRQIESMVNA